LNLRKNSKNFEFHGKLFDFPWKLVQFPGGSWEKHTFKKYIINRTCAQRKEQGRVADNLEENKKSSVEVTQFD